MQQLNVQRWMYFHDPGSSEDEKTIQLREVEPQTWKGMGCLRQEDD
jgi:hypothetical protein